MSVQSSNHRDSKGRGNDLCKTPECKAMADEIIANMDPAVDPCGDFYAFACGGFVQRKEIPFDAAEVSNMELSRSDRIARQILEANPKTLKDINGKKLDAASVRNLKKIQSVYKMCMNETELEFVGVSPLRSELKQLVTEVIKMSLSLVFENNSYVDAAKLAQDIITFETQLASISSTAVEKSEFVNIFNARTAGQLNKINPMIDWAMLVEKSLGHAGENDKTILVSSPVYLEKLGQLLSQTPPATLQTFLAWKVIMSQGRRLSAKYRAPLETLDAILKGADPSKPPQRWRSCVTSVSTNMGHLIGYFYIGLHATEADRKAMVGIINAIKGSYLAGIPNVDWIDNKTLASAINKIEAMDSVVGWSGTDPNIESSTELEQYYASVKIKEGDYYGAIDHALRSLVAKSLARAGKRIERQRMFADPQTVNAFHLPMRNQIMFPAAIIQPPMYRSSAPEYLNYGSIGFLASHEITHSLDTNGRKFDEKGLIKDWWTNSTVEQFTTKAQCIIDQYSNFTVSIPSTNTTLPVNGHLTVGENIADGGGVKYAFQTWLSRYNADSRRRHRGGKNPRINNQMLPGLERWTREQLFFVSFGQLFCIKWTPAIAQQIVMTDPHAPPPWRINGALMNLPDFAKTFKCPLGSPMNPSKKCLVW
ncbi:hypothetical protein BGZ73_004607 [Actinomortierella ambigua]|nr:hypothetical protein BGZ73_004607 [Actinomortierella ambigua]